MTAEILKGAIRFFMMTGLVWLAAWLFHPAFDHGTIWFIGAVAGFILNGVKSA